MTRSCLQTQFSSKLFRCMAHTIACHAVKIQRATLALMQVLTGQIMLWILLWSEWAWNRKVCFQAS